MPGAIGERFECALPGHHGGAVVVRDPRSTRFKYRCLHIRDSRQAWWTLAHVRAAHAYKRLRAELSDIELRSWWLRLAYEAALYRPEPVQYLPADPDLTVVQRKAFDGLLLLVTLRAGEPVAFARRFAGPWSGVGVRQAGEATTQLLDSGLIVPAGTYSYGSGDYRRGRLFLPAGVRP